MATRKKSSIGRARKRRTVKRKSTAKKSLGATLRAFGKTWTKKACSKTKGAATKSANASKRAGRSAMVKKNPAGGYCVFTRGKKK
jgi:hypothetical protein